MILSPRKRSLLGESDRAPAGAAKPLGLRHFSRGELRSPMPPSREAAFGGEDGRRRARESPLMFASERQ